MKTLPLILLILISSIIVSCGQVIPLSASVPIKASTSTITTHTTFTSPARSVDTTKIFSPIITASDTLYTPTSIHENSANIFFIRDIIPVTMPSQEDFGTIPSIWDAYKLYDLNLIKPGVKDYSVEMFVDQPLLIPWTWCALEKRLQNNLKHLAVKIIINDMTVPESIIMKYPTSPQGYECQTWVIKIPWLVNNFVLQIQYRMDEIINDGASSYPAGNYILRISGWIKYKKQLLSDKYGFGITLPYYSDITFYHPEEIESIFEAYLSKHLENGGDVVTQFISWVENSTDICHPNLNKQSKLIDPDTEILTENVNLGGLPFIKVFTPNLYGDDWEERQAIEYMTLGNNVCVHISIYLGIHYFDRGDAITPNMLDIMNSDVDKIISTFRWIDL